MLPAISQKGQAFNIFVIGKGRIARRPIAADSARSCGKPRSSLPPSSALRSTNVPWPSRKRCTTTRFSSAGQGRRHHAGDAHQRRVGEGWPHGRDHPRPRRDLVGETFLAGVVGGGGECARLAAKLLNSRRIIHHKKIPGPRGWLAAAWCVCRSGALQPQPLNSRRNRPCTSSLPSFPCSTRSAPRVLRRHLDCEVAADAPWEGRVAMDRAKLPAPRRPCTSSGARTMRRPMSPCWSWWTTMSKRPSRL